jgi:site-specific DNA-methyltransferase (cytosine-N4-specific)
VTDLEPFLGRITKADSRKIPLPDHSVDGIAVTSSPYWGLRVYGDDEAEIGRGSLGEFIVDAADTLDELGRVLVEDALVWWNIADTRTGSGGAGGDYNRRGDDAANARRYRQGDSGLPRGQWAMVPHRFALEAQARGWLVLADVTWSKGKVRLRNGVPELLTRRRPENLHYVKRPGISSERIFLFARTLDARRRFRPSMLEELGDVWTFPPDSVKGRKHAAPFPPELARRCILPSTLPGDVVLDPFAGSGTTLHVAEKHGRRAIGFDLYLDDEAPS